MPTTLKQDKQNHSSIIEMYERDIALTQAQLQDPALHTSDRQNALMLISKTYDLIDREKEKIEGKKNHNFVQLYRDNLDKIGELARKNSMAISILFYFFKSINRQNSVIVNQMVLAEHFDVTRQTINTAIKNLKKMGFINILKTGGQCIYVINSDVVWTTYNDKRTTATFTAQVVVNLNEQDTQTRQSAKTVTAPYTANDMYNAHMEADLAEV